MTNLSDLIERVEAAKEGSGQLSHEVLLAMGHVWNLDFGSSWYAWPGAKPSERIYAHKADVTRSLEAAMRLAPSGWRVRLEYGDNYACASFVKGYGSRRTVWGDCTSERPDDEIALALVAASLRALQEKDIEHG